MLTLITEGLGNAPIAERLSISDKTVRNHVSNLFDKLGVWKRAQWEIGQGSYANSNVFTRPTNPPVSTTQSTSALNL